MVKDSINDNLKKKVIKYPLASAKSRLFARIIDIIFINTFLLIIGFLIFLFDSNFKGSLVDFYPIDAFRFLLFAIIILVSNIVYFISLPFFWDGKTLGKKIFNLKIHGLNMKRKIMNVIKHEFFLSLLPTSLSFSLAIVFFILGIINPSNIEKLIKSFLLNNNENSIFSLVVLIYVNLYSSYMLVLFIIILSTLLNSKSKSLNDKFSNVVTIELLDCSNINENSKNTKSDKKY